jgi:hypothetical protein
MPVNRFVLPALLALSLGVLLPGALIDGARGALLDAHIECARGAA